MYYATSASKSFVKAFSHTHNSHFIQSFFIRKRGWFSKALKLLLCLQLSRVLRSWLKFCRVGVHFQSRPISSSWTLWLKIPQKKEMTCFNLPRALASFIVFKHSSYFLLTAPFNFVSNHDVNWVCQVLLLSKSVINACLFWQMTWAMIHQSLQTQGGKHQTSDPPLNPSYKGILQTWKQRGVWLTKDAKSKKKAMFIYF